MKNGILKSGALVMCALAVLLTLASCQTGQLSCKCCKAKVAVKSLTKEDFYTDGALNADASKQAYYDLMTKFNYPILAPLKTNQFWVCDFLQDDMTKLGMGGVFWINEEGVYGKTGTKEYKGKYAGQKFGYLAHDIFLLPGQALPEHRHIGGPNDFGPKMEAWFVKYGSVTFYAEKAAPGGEEKLISSLPKAEQPWGYGQPWFKCKYYVKKKAGELYKLSDPESWHFQCADGEGAIVAETGTFHNQVEFSKPDMKFANTGSK